MLLCARAGPDIVVSLPSFARYDPDDAFFSPESRRPLTASERSQLMERCCKVFAHETSHVLGVSMYSGAGVRACLCRSACVGGVVVGGGGGCERVLAVQAGLLLLLLLLAV